MPYKDPEARRAYERAWRKRSAKHVLNRKYQDATIHANRRAAGYGVAGRLSAADIRSLLEGALCAYCGSAERLTVDHVVPMALGGTNTVSNLAPACHGCNAQKRRGTQPGRWSQLFDACQECGSAESRHAARGICNRCYCRGRRSA